MANLVYERGGYLNRLWGHGIFGKLLGGLWFIYGLFAFVRDESKSVQERVGGNPMIDWFLGIPFAWWCAGTLLIALLWLFESSYREDRDARKEITRLKLELHNGAKRQAAIDRLWALRAEGIKIRNEMVQLPDFADYHTRWHDWRARTWAEAHTVNPNLKHWLEYLDQLGPPPKRDDPYCNLEHKKLVEAGSETLVRLQRFLEGEIG